MKSIWHRMSKCLLRKFDENDGVSAVIVAIGIVVLVGFAALAIDIGHLAVVRNELQNAADAGALNGARVLYTVDGAGELTVPMTVYTGANAEARDAAIANTSDKSAVEVTLGDNDADVIRGNWDKSTNTFTACPSDFPLGCDDPDHINAMSVTVHRSSAISFFAKIFGVDSFSSQASAIAYRGYVGDEVVYDQPIAMCRDSLICHEGPGCQTEPITCGDPPGFICTRGRMFNSGGDSATNETSRWTNFSEECVEAANTPSIVGAICHSSDPVNQGTISTSAGTVNPAMNEIRDCWRAAADSDGDGIPDQPWNMKLPVVRCETPSSCSEIVGAVSVTVVWITETGGDPDFTEIPVTMGDWSQASDCSTFDLTSETGRRSCWATFATHFNLTYINETGEETCITTLTNPPGLGYMQQTMYFIPVCEDMTPGGPGGEDFGVISKNPKLVK